MPYKIILWNTQHFHNQSAKESQAYLEKAAFLKKLLLHKRPDLLALFETGTTGVPNVSAERLLNTWGYQLVHALDNEGGSRADTTLGSMVFVRTELVGAFEMLPYYVLGESERRAPIIIRHKYTADALAFYHANSSAKASNLTAETIKFIVENLGHHFRELIFFGGDLNCEPHANHEEIRGLAHKPLKPVAPAVAGTHIQITNKTLKDSSSDWKHNVENVFDFETGEDVPKVPLKQWHHQYRWDEAITEDEFVPTPRVLDYAYVTDTYRWSAECDGRHESIPNGRGGYKDIRRLYYGDVIRSDHFPVFYFAKGPLEEAMFRVQIAEDLYSLDSGTRSNFNNSGQTVNLRFGSFKTSPVEMEPRIAATYWAWQSAKTLRISSIANLAAQFRYNKQKGTRWPAIIEFPIGGGTKVITFYVTAIDYE